MDVQEVIKTIRSEWQAIKSNQVILLEKSNIRDLADKYRTCTLFKGNEDVEELFKIAMSPQGQEFCTRFNFPSLINLEIISNYTYLGGRQLLVNEGEIPITDPHNKSFIIAGNTRAKIMLSDNKQMYNIMILHGAVVDIYIRSWVIVKLRKSRGTKVTITAEDNALIL